VVIAKGFLLLHIFQQLQMVLNIHSALLTDTQKTLIDCHFHSVELLWRIQTDCHPFHLIYAAREFSVPVFPEGVRCRVAIPGHAFITSLAIAWGSRNCFWPCSRLRPGILVNRPVRTRMPGGVGDRGYPPRLPDSPQAINLWQKTF